MPIGSPPSNFNPTGRAQTPHCQPLSVASQAGEAPAKLELPPPLHESHAINIPVLTAGFAVLSAVALRAFHLGGQSLWYDEGYTALASKLSLANLLLFVKSDTYPPLYPLLQHGWVLLFGDSEVAMRGVSAFCGILSVPVFCVFAKKALKDNAAVALAIWLFSFSILQVWYSREARTYELASFLALVSLAALVFFLERKTKWLFATIVAAMAASLYAHNMMFFYVFALNVFWLTYPSERGWKERTKEALLADALAAILYLPWVPSLLQQMSVVERGFWIPKPTISTLLQTLRLLAGFSVDYLSALTTRLGLLPASFASLFILCGISLLCAALLVGGLWSIPRTEKTRMASFCSYGLLPLLAVFVLSRLSRPLYIDRVFIASSVVAPIVLAFPLAAQRTRKGRILYGALGSVLAVVTALSGIGYLRNHPKQDWRGAIASLLSIHEDDRLVVFMPTAGELLFDYYGPKQAGGTRLSSHIGLPSSRLERFPPQLGATSGPTDITPLKAALESRDYREIDLVVSPESGPDMEPLVDRYLKQSFQYFSEQSFNEVRLIRFRKRSR